MEFYTLERSYASYPSLKHLIAKDFFSISFSPVIIFLKREIVGVAEVKRVGMGCTRPQFSELLFYRCCSHVEFEGKLETHA